MSDEDTYTRAREHVTMIRDFWFHLATFVLVGTLLVILDRRGGEGSQTFMGLDWAFWVVLFWGFGVACHGIWAYFSDHRADRFAAKASKS